ncbi:hypothetical protein ALC57_02515 [Trachymyrmex cornetzi]|uniref:Uncharacterized protein n=1 Tax=Trachymyrmex cornetzi TaxID=471704 RepID=A0A195EJM2_9HYME|nr:hypothetical protein ALC57_02515 [Trachymyrmex cornetzi]
MKAEGIKIMRGSLLGTFSNIQYSADANVIFYVLRKGML